MPSHQATIHSFFSTKKKDDSVLDQNDSSIVAVSAAPTPVVKAIPIDNVLLSSIKERELIDRVAEFTYSLPDLNLVNIGSSEYWNVPISSKTGAIPIPSVGKPLSSQKSSELLSLLKTPIFRLDKSACESTKELHNVSLSSMGNCIFYQFVPDQFTSFYNTSQSSKSVKIAAFDFDRTLIYPTEGKPHCLTHSDWEFYSVNVKEKLNQLYSNGYHICVFTNQYGVSSGKVSVADLIGRLKKFGEAVQVPIRFFASAEKDFYRKPGIGMWIALSVILGSSNHSINYKDSFYVGDAAGRPKRIFRADSFSGKVPIPDEYGKKDHSSADVLFAVQNQLEFHTPESYFLGSRHDIDVAPLKNSTFLLENVNDSTLNMDCTRSSSSSSTSSSKSRSTSKGAEQQQKAVLGFSPLHSIPGPWGSAWALWTALGFAPSPLKQERENSAVASKRSREEFDSSPSPSTCSCSSSTLSTESGPALKVRRSGNATNALSSTECKCEKESEADIPQTPFPLSPELILLVAPPAMGKSHLSKFIARTSGGTAVRVNQDSLKTREMCMKVARSLLSGKFAADFANSVFSTNVISALLASNGVSSVHELLGLAKTDDLSKLGSEKSNLKRAVIVDATNLDPAARLAWRTLAKEPELAVPLRIVYLGGSKSLSFHLNGLRSRAFVPTDSTAVESVTIHTAFKKVRETDIFDGKFVSEETLEASSSSKSVQSSPNSSKGWFPLIPTPADIVLRGEQPKAFSATAQMNLETLQSEAVWPKHKQGVYSRVIKVNEMEQIVLLPFRPLIPCLLRGLKTLCIGCSLKRFMIYSVHE